ncbi:hypothetical protein AgCh_024405 [Apium graveolens]
MSLGKYVVYTTYPPDLKSSAGKAVLIDKGKGIPLMDILNDYIILRTDKCVRDKLALFCDILSIPFVRKSTAKKFGGQLYLLAKDQGYISQPDLVWEMLNEAQTEKGNWKESNLWCSDRRWKDIHTFDYPKGFKHVEFVSAGLRDSISEQEDIDKSIMKLSWVKYNEKLKLIKSRTRGGIGHSNMEILRSDPLDTNTLIENLGERISPSHLEKVEAVKIVHRKIHDNNVREEILYFFRDGKVKSFTLKQLLMKTVTELKYIHYLLRVENSVTRNWSLMILEVIRRRVMMKDDKYNGDYVPEYRTCTGQEMKMKKGATVLQVFVNSPQLSFSPDHEDVSLSYMLIGDLEIRKSSISKLRSAIYQLGEDTEEKRDLKKKLVKVLRDKEEE